MWCNCTQSVYYIQKPTLSTPPVQGSRWECDHMSSARQTCWQSQQKHIDTSKTNQLICKFKCTLFQEYVQCFTWWCHSFFTILYSIALDCIQLKSCPFFTLGLHLSMYRSISCLVFPNHKMSCLIHKSKKFSSVSLKE